MSTQFRAFRPSAATQNIAVGTTATPATLTGFMGTSAIRMCNIGNQPIFFRTREAGDTVDATLSNAIPVPAGQTEIFTLPSGTTSISVIAGSTGSTLYFTLGEGL